MSLLGHYNNFFFACHLLDIAMGVKTLRTILSSVTHNGKQVQQNYSLSRRTLKFVRCITALMIDGRAPAFLLCGIAVSSKQHVINVEGFEMKVLIFCYGVDDYYFLLHI